MEEKKQDATVGIMAIIILVMLVAAVKVTSSNTGAGARQVRAQVNEDKLIEDYLNSNEYKDYILRDK